MTSHRFPYALLQELIEEVFQAVGCEPREAAVVADHLIQANLTGHDSHGVIRTPIYVRWLKEGNVFANRRATILFENDVLAVIDGQMGLGQSIAEQTMTLAIQKARRSGVAVTALRNCGHVGRVGHWAETVVAAGLISLHFVNTSGLGLLVAPFGGISRRLSANPVAAGIPVAGGEPIIFDISTSSVAEGKLKVAYNKGVPAPDGCIIDAQGRPTTDPRVFYADPPGAILPFGGYKGYGLGLVAEILAGALTGSGCSQPGKTRLEQGMLSIVLDPAMFQVQDHFLDEVKQFLDFVKSSERVSPAEEILVPGDVERRHRAERTAAGIELDENTWSQIVACARSLGLAEEQIARTQGTIA